VTHRQKIGDAALETPGTEDHLRGSIIEKVQVGAEFPVSAVFSVTERCPLSCAHCYIANADLRNEMNISEIASALDQLADAGTFRLSITGGEPLLRHDLCQIVEQAWKRRFLISLKTSASILSLQTLETMRDNGLAALNVSLYHVDPVAHDRFVGRDGAWKNTVTCLERFASLGGIVTVGMVLMEWNAKAVGSLERLCSTNGWSFVADPKVTHRQDGDCAPAALRAREETLTEAWQNMKEIVQPRPTHLADETLCKVGRDLVYFTSSGEIWLCPALPVSIGNIRHGNFKTIWAESRLRESLTRLTWGASPECLTCASEPFCSRCPGESLLEHGDYRIAATVDCLVARARALAWSRQNAGTSQIHDGCAFSR
jgi:radical SAM protein with 4Fe4S-binding SPASM domain